MKFNIIVGDVSSSNLTKYITFRHKSYFMRQSNFAERYYVDFMDPGILIFQWWEQKYERLYMANCIQISFIHLFFRYLIRNYKKNLINSLLFWNFPEKYDELHIDKIHIFVNLMVLKFKYKNKKN